MYVYSEMAKTAVVIDNVLKRESEPDKESEQTLIDPKRLSEYGLDRRTVVAESIMALSPMYLTKRIAVIGKSGKELGKRRSGSRLELRFGYNGKTLRCELTPQEYYAVLLKDGMPPEKALHTVYYDRDNGFCPKGVANAITYTQKDSYFSAVVKDDSGDLMPICLGYSYHFPGTVMEDLMYGVRNNIRAKTYLDRVEKKLKRWYETRLVGTATDLVTPYDGVNTTLRVTSRYIDENSDIVEEVGALFELSEADFRDFYYDGNNKKILEIGNKVLCA